MPITRLNVPATTPMTTYSRSRSRLAMKPVAVMSTTIEFEISSPTMNASIIGMPEALAGAPPIAAMSSDLRARLRADAVDHPDPERGAGAVRGHLHRVDVLVAVEPRLEPAPRVADRVEDEHPPAPEPELAAVPRVLVERDEDPDRRGRRGSRRRPGP